MNAFILVECKLVPKRERHWDYLINMNFYDQFVYNARCFLPLVTSICCVKYAKTNKNRCIALAASTSDLNPKYSTTRVKYSFLKFAESKWFFRVEFLLACILFHCKSLLNGDSNAQVFCNVLVQCALQRQNKSFDTLFIQQ